MHCHIRRDLMRSGHNPFRTENEWVIPWTTQGMYLWADSFFAKALRSVTDGLIETLRKPKINRRCSPIKQWLCKASITRPPTDSPCGASIAPFCRVTHLYCTFLKPVVLKLSLASESPRAKQNTACQAPPTTSSWFSLSGRRRPRMCVFMSSWMTSLLLFPEPHLAMPWNFSRARHLLERQLLSNPAHTMSKLQWDQGQPRSPPSCLALSTLCPRRGQQQGLWTVGVEQAPSELVHSFLTASRPRRGCGSTGPCQLSSFTKADAPLSDPERTGWDEAGFGVPESPAQWPNWCRLAGSPLWLRTPISRPQPIHDTVPTWTSEGQTFSALCIRMPFSACPSTHALLNYTQEVLIKYLPNLIEKYLQARQWAL